MTTPSLTELIQGNLRIVSAKKRKVKAKARPPPRQNVSDRLHAFRVPDPVRPPPVGGRRGATHDARAHDQEIGRARDPPSRAPTASVTT